jgi:hypothetical protein
MLLMLFQVVAIQPAAGEERPAVTVLPSTT